MSDDEVIERGEALWRSGGGRSPSAGECPLRAGEGCSVSDLWRAMSRLETKLHNDREAVKAHDRVLFGNGRPGLKETVDKMSARQQIILWVMSAVAVAAIGQFVLMALGKG